MSFTQNTDMSRLWPLTSVSLQLLAVVSQGVVVEAQVDLDGSNCSLAIEGMHPEHILQL